MLRPAAWLVCLLACAGCGHRRPPPVSDRVPDSDAAEAGRFELPSSGPPGDAAGFCGSLSVPIIVERPNLYFVLDASRSMIANMTTANEYGFIPSRYRAAYEAIQSVLEAVGHRVSYGAALFPTEVDAASACQPGEEIFPTRPGDTESFAVTGKDGPVLQTLITRLRNHAPAGGTPTAATLRSLEHTILALPGRTYVLLLTDGAPNCNVDANCSAANCTINVENACSPTDPTLNCCDPRSGTGADFRDCVDGDATVSAILDYAKNGVPTYVIGMSDVKLYYQSLLDRMAEAGATARATEPRYYQADSGDDLVSALRGIGLSVSISCEVTLSTPPPDPTRVNVYFDQRVVKQNATSGWVWDTPDGAPPAPREPQSDGQAGLDAGSPVRIRIVGNECDSLKNGDVIELRVFAGCPTVVH